MDDSEIEQSQLVQPESEELSNGTKSESPLLRLKKLLRVKVSLLRQLV